MNKYLQYLSLVVLLAGLVGTYAVGQDHIKDNKVEIDKLKEKTNDMNLTEYQIDELKLAMKELKSDVKKILSIVGK